MMTSDESTRHARTVLIYPEWSQDPGGNLDISDSLRKRLRNWNKDWENILDPVTSIVWPDLAFGRAWIAEGKRLVADLQDELGPDIYVVGDFNAYDPDAR